MMGHDELEIRGTGRERGHRCRSGTRQEAVDDAAGAAVGAGMGGGAHALREATTHFCMIAFPFVLAYVHQNAIFVLNMIAFPSV